MRAIPRYHRLPGTATEMRENFIDEGLYLRSKVHYRFVLEQAGILEQVEVLAIRCLLAYAAQLRKQTAVS